MSIVKINKKDNYAIISNLPLNDRKLSWKARGILAYLLSKPNNWTVSLGDLIRMSENDGERSIKSALKELRDFGYAKMRRGEFKDGKGKRKLGTFYDIFEEPQTS
jgi:hypothetical protein